MPARGPKVSTQKPCPPRQFLQQKHVQANPGDKIQVEWATGHTNSFGSFVLVAAEDEHRLLEYSNKVFDEYYAGAKSPKYFDAFQITKSVDQFQSYLKHNAEQKCEGVPAKANVFSQAVTGKTAHNRPAGFRALSNAGAAPGFLKYNPDIPEACRSMRWASYVNDKYPWIKAASGYNVVAHYPTEGAISTFEVPSNLDAGKYILHWWWRGYFNCVDVDILDEKKDGKVEDMWGSADATNVVMVKIDHCQSWKHTEAQANHAPFTLQQKEDLRKAAAKAKPKYQPAAAAMDKAEAAHLEAAAAYDAAVAEQTAAQEELNLANGQLEQASKARKEAAQIRPRDAAAVERADKAKSEATKVKDAANQVLKKAKTDKQATQKASQQAARTSKSKTSLHKTAFVNYYGKLNQVDWGVSYPLCTVVPDGDTDASVCTTLCTEAIGKDRLKNSAGCDSINVIPWKLPGTSAFPGQLNPAIPDQCKDMEVADGARICYALKEGKATDAGSAFTITADPEDPVFYSTCFKLQPSADIQFDGPTCGKACELPETATPPAWRYGEKCVSCGQMKFNANISTSFVPEWELASECKKCS